MAVSAYGVDGLAEFRRELRALGPKWPRELTKVHKAASTRVQRRARFLARSMGGVQAHAAVTIKAYATATKASVGVSPTSAHPEAFVAFWGAEKRTGWFARPRYAGLFSQHLPWVGSNWDPGRRGQGPYAINDAVADELPKVIEEYGRGIDNLMARAFPNG